MNQSGILHRHADGREHRHFSAGFTIGGQVIEDHDGTEEHSHGILGSEDGKSGPVVWVGESRLSSIPIRRSDRGVPTNEEVSE